MSLTAQRHPARLPAEPGPDLSRLSGPGLRAFLNLAELWELTLDEQRALLGGVSRSTFTRWKKERNALLTVDQLERISHLLGIHQCLEVLMPAHGAKWPRTANDLELFQGEPPLRHMIEGGITGLRRVRELLAAQRGW
jgi:hypothetical protein